MPTDVINDGSGKCIPGGRSSCLLLQQLAVARKHDAQHEQSGHNMFPRLARQPGRSCLVSENETWGQYMPIILDIQCKILILNFIFFTLNEFLLFAIVACYVTVK